MENYYMFINIYCYDYIIKLKMNLFFGRSNDIFKLGLKINVIKYISKIMILYLREKEFCI